MKNLKDKSRIFTRFQVDTLLSAVIGQTLEAVDKAGLFKLHAGREKVKGIAGDIIEVSVLGCNKDSLQEPDIIVDGELTEIKTTGMVKPKKNDSPYLFECKEPVSVTAVTHTATIYSQHTTQETLLLCTNRNQYFLYGQSFVSSNHKRPSVLRSKIRQRARGRTRVPCQGHSSECQSSAPL